MRLSLLGLYSNVRDRSDKNQNPKDEWRHEAPPFIFWVYVLSKPYIAIPIHEREATLCKDFKSTKWLCHFVLLD